MPGVSISAPPSGSGISSRCVVVWRPRLSSSRTSAVRSRSSPSMQFTMVDLPTPGGAQQRHGAARRRERPGARRAMLLARALHGHDRRCPGDCRGFRHAACQIVAEIGFVQHDDRGGAAFGGQGQIAFQAAKVEIAIQAADQKDQVDVGGDGLLVFAPSGGAARKEGAARQHGFDDRLLRPIIARGHPIADDGHAGAVGRAVPEAAAGFGIEIAGLR